MPSRTWSSTGRDYVSRSHCKRGLFTPWTLGKNWPSNPCSREPPSLVAHDCGYPLSRYTCRATRVAADFLDFIAFCRCSTGVALHPLKMLVSHLPPPVPGGVAPKFGSEKVSRYGGVAATVAGVALHCATKPPRKTRKWGFFSWRNSQEPKVPTFLGITPFL